LPWLQAFRTGPSLRVPVLAGRVMFRACPLRGRGGGWTAWRVLAVVVGSVLALVSLGLLGGGATLVWADQALRQDGYVTTGTAAHTTTGHALASERVTLGWGWLLTGLVGDVRLRVTSASPGRPVFVAIGPADRVAAYLSGTAYTTVTGAGTGAMASRGGAARPAPPAWRPGSGLPRPRGREPRR
jgi:hypothetical protein